MSENNEEILLPQIVMTQLQDTAKEWERVRLIYESALKQINTKIEILNREFELTHKYNPIEHITSRIKSPESIAKKLRHNDLEISVQNIVDHIHDVAGIRIICSFTSDIYRLAELIEKQGDVTIIKIKDYIANPKENGYKSYHMIVSVPVYFSENVVNAKVEIQIRTIAMDFWASLEHKMYYKFEGNAPSNIKRELKECADLAAFLDAKMLAINEQIQASSGETETENAFIYEETTVNAGVKDKKKAGFEEVEVYESDYIEVVKTDDDSDMLSRLKNSFGAVAASHN